jgi:hypothetical protein
MKAIRILVLPLAAFAMSLFAAAPQMPAETPEHCQRRVIHAEHELHEAIERHGRESRAAEVKRHELHEARERCWAEQHRWWDDREHRWHTERDWDDHDRD